MQLCKISRNCWNTGGKIDKKFKKLYSFVASFYAKSQEIHKKLEALEKLKTKKREIALLERKIREKNIVFFGINDERDENLLQNFLVLAKNQLISSIIERDIDNIYRIGKKTATANRPTLIEFVFQKN